MQKNALKSTANPGWSPYILFRGWPLFLLLSLVFLRANAQKEKTLIIGFTASPGISWLQTGNSHYTSGGVRFSLGYGIDMDFYFKKYNYAVSAGLQVVNWGGKTSYPDLYPERNSGKLTRVTSNSVYKYSAVHLPFYLKLKTNPIGYNTFFAGFGMSFLIPFKTSITTTSTYPDGSTVRRETTSILGNTPFGAINLYLNAGIELPISGNTKAQLGITFLNGITSLSKGKAYKTDGDGQVLQEEIDNGGTPTGDKLVFYLKGLYLNLKIVF